MDSRGFPRALSAWIAALLLVASAPLAAAPPRVVFFFIGDGMGFEQVKAARSYAGEPLSFELLPHRAECRTYAADNAVTDSGAGGTALATGIKVNNGVISQEIPGTGAELLTLLEHAQQMGKMTGLVTTAYLTHATPATFGAHAASRNHLDDIAGDYLDQTRPDVLFGGGGQGLTVEAAQAAGYAVAVDAAGFSALDARTPGARVSALFGEDHLPYEHDSIKSGEDYPYPHLSEMVAKAIEVLDRDPDGFFLMVEGARIDHAGHDNQLERMVHETLQFAAALQVAVEWAANRTDTLIIVTADHETGGLKVVEDNGAGRYPSVTWSTTGHTAVNVPLYAWGVNAQLISGIMDNTDMFEVCTADTAASRVASPETRAGREAREPVLQP